MQISTVIFLVWAALCYLFCVGWNRWNKREQANMHAEQQAALWHTLNTHTQRWIAHKGR